MINKKISIFGIIIVGWILLTGSVFSKKNITKPLFEIKVDQRVELMSIICFLAEYPEYSQGRCQPYLKEVNSHFNKFKNHAVVQLMRRLRKKRNIGYNAPMSLAVNLPKDFFNDQSNAKLLKPSKVIDSRWTLNEINKFIKLAKGFAKQTDFIKFHNMQYDIYEVTILNLKNKLWSDRHFKFYNKFLKNKSRTRFKIIIAMLNGEHTYGVLNREKKSMEFSCVLGVWNSTWNNSPYYKNAQTVIIDMFCQLTNTTVKKNQNNLLNFNPQKMVLLSLLSISFLVTTLVSIWGHRYLKKKRINKLS